MQKEDFENLKEAFRKASLAFALFEGQLRHIEQQFQNEECVRHGIDLFSHSIGTWHCPTSPIEKCVYNDEEDPAWDNCIFCGQPDERK